MTIIDVEKWDSLELGVGRPKPEAGRRAIEKVKSGF
jgi:hypothetical protein